MTAGNHSNQRGTDIMALRLEDIELIKQLKHKYWRCIDTGDIASLKDVFTEDVTCEYVGGTYHWKLQGRDNMLASIAAAFHEKAVACHTGHHPEIEVQTDTTATGTWYLTDEFWDFDKMLYTKGSALYRDRYVRNDGRWQIAHTGYERVYEIVDPITTMPNLTSHWLKRIPKPAA